jgi:hypothetical protein
MTAEVKGFSGDFGGDRAVFKGQAAEVTGLSIHGRVFELVGVGKGVIFVFRVRLRVRLRL